MILKQYPDGSDLTIMNCYYQYGLKDPVSGKRKPDYLTMVYKDNTTGKKKYEIIEKPEYTFFKVKDGLIIDHNLLFIEKEHVEPVTCKYSELEKTIANITENMDFYKSNIENGNRGENRKLHTIPTIFRSDIPIEDSYRFQFGHRFTNNIHKISKAFFDIEVDTRWMSGDFVQMGECPVNAIAFMDESRNIIHSFLLRDSRNPLIEEFENEIKNGLFNLTDIRNFITEAIGGWKQLHRYQLDETKIDIQFFDDELDLIRTFFETVHRYCPDFIMGWNSSGFDLNYLIERIKVLGANPEDIMCDQNWKKKVVKHYIDQKNLSNFAERGDYTFISGCTTWIDQMIQYCSKRKSKIGSYSSFKLDDIGKLEAKVQKLDYSHITTNIAMLPWLNFKIFTLYNIFDVIVQKCIEHKCKDLEYIFAKCIINNTSYKKGHRQTVYLINRMAKEFDKLGYIIGNNKNKWNEEPDKFLGALVGDPKHTNAYSKMIVNGVPIYVCENLQDYDYKSLYPSIDLEFNIAPNTQVGKIVIDKQVYSGENAYNNPKYSRGGEFIENLVTDNTIEFCKRWLHLAGFKDFLIDMQEYYEKTRICYSANNIYQRYYYVEGKGVVEVPIRDIGTDKIKPIRFVDNSKPIKPLRFYGPKPGGINV